MGRPDLSEQRTAEILDAFERCVARYGLASSSLEMVAEEAGMKRSILRHYIGNRDEMVEALAKRVMTKYRRQLDETFTGLPDRNPIGHLLDFLFSESSEQDVQSMLVVEALIAASEEFPICRELVSDYVRHLVDRITKLLKSERAKIPPRNCWAVAYGIVGICFNNESLVPLELPRKYAAASRDCAERLVNSLS